jgi:hypothetical protein
VELFFHPDVPLEVEGSDVRLRAPRADVWLFGPAGTQLRQEPGWISRGYGLREPATVLVYSVRAHVPVRLETRLVLVPPGTSSSAARSLFGLG